MRKWIWVALIACVASGGGVSVFGYDYENDDPPAYTQVRWSRVDSEMNQLNRMLGNVRWQLRNYKKGPQFRERFNHTAHDIDKLNAEFRSGTYDRRRLLGEIVRLHNELHQIEVDLHVKKADLYLWR